LEEIKHELKQLYEIIAPSSALKEDFAPPPDLSIMIILHLLMAS
jgi:hypothetical protein